MQIEKINENQVEVVLNLEDLKQNNISLHSFMCNSPDSQNLFFDILSFANAEVGFNLKNCEIVIEAFSVPTKNSFILLITRIPILIPMHISKTKYGTFRAYKSFWLKFNNFEDFCMFSNSLKHNLNIKSSLFLLDNCYFLYIKLSFIKDIFKVLLSASEFSNDILGPNFILNENAKAIIKNSAIETSKKYFI